MATSVWPTLNTAAVSKYKSIVANFTYNKETLFTVLCVVKQNTSVKNSSGRRMTLKIRASLLHLMVSHNIFIIYLVSYLDITSYLHLPNAWNLIILVFFQIKIRISLKFIPLF
jgi:hypothetical protein